MRASKENSSRMENELRNMRREMDELGNTVKDKAVENLDEMIQRKDSPFTTEVLNRPLPLKSAFPNWSILTIQEIPWITSSHSKL